MMLCCGRFGVVSLDGKERGKERSAKERRDRVTYPLLIHDMIRLRLIFADSLREDGGRGGGRRRSRLQYLKKNHLP